MNICNIYSIDNRFYLFTFLDFSAADAVASETEEVTEVAEENAEAAGSDPAEQVSDISSKQGDCLKSCDLFKVITCFSF